MKKKQAKQRSASPVFRWTSSHRINVLTIISAVLICYFPVFGAEFINFDDLRLIINNPAVNGSGDTFEFIRRWIHSPHYKPLVVLTWKLEYFIAGEDPFLYHFNNILLHIFNSLLVYRLGLVFAPKFGIRKATGTTFALFVALLFAIHPLHVESVAWATERKDVLYSFFYLLSLVMYVKHLENPGGHSTKWVILSVLMFLFAGLSKAMAITLPVILVLIDWLWDKPMRLASIRSKVWHIGVLVLLAWLYGLFSELSESTPGLSAGVSMEAQHWLPAAMASLPEPVSRFLIIAFRLFLWLIHVIVPFGSSLIYPRNEMLEFVGIGIYLAPVILLAIGWFAFKNRNKRKTLFFGFSWFVMSMLPALGTDDRLTSSFLADRYVYLAVTGILFLAAVVMVRYLEKRALSGTGICLGVVLLLMIQSILLSMAWKDSTSIWTRATRVCNSCTDAWLNRGVHLFNQQEYKLAINDFNRAIALNPESTITLKNRARWYVLHGQAGKALEDLDKVIALTPDDAEAVSLKAGTLLQLGRQDEALAFYNRAEEMGHRTFGLFNNKGTIFYGAGKYREALDNFLQAYALNPVDGKLLMNIALCHLALGDRNSALDFRDKAIATGEQFPPAILNSF